MLLQGICNIMFMIRVMTILILYPQVLETVLSPQHELEAASAPCDTHMETMDTTSRTMGCQTSIRKSLREHRSKRVQTFIPGIRKGELYSGPSF